eukprot:3905640-Rhodomonas_salina.1
MHSGNATITIATPFQDSSTRQSKEDQHWGIAQRRRRLGGERMRRSSWILAVVVVLASVIGGNGMSGTGKEAFISPLRPREVMSCLVCVGIRYTAYSMPDCTDAAFERRFTFNRDEAPIRVPLVVNVFLLNVDYNSNN